MRRESLIVAAVVAAAVLAYAFPGGTYDVVARQEWGVAIWWVIALGFGFGVLPRGVPAPVPAALAGAGLAALAGWTALSMGWTESQERTSVEIARVLHHAGVVVLVASLVRRETVSAACGGLIAGVGIVCVAALASRLWPESFPADAVRESFGGNRLNYPLAYWNAVAAWGALAATMALAWSAHHPSAAGRALALGLVPVAVTVTYLTYSRAGAGGVAAGVLIVWLVSHARALTLLHVAGAAIGSWLVIRSVRASEPIAQATGGEGRGTVLVALVVACGGCAALAALLAHAKADRAMRLPARVGRPLLAVAGVAAAVACAAAGPGVVERGWDEFRGSARFNLTSDDPAARLGRLSGNRYNLWRSALDAFEADPQQGRGAGTFEFWWSRTGANGEFVRDAHSLYLETLAELGWPGLLALLVAVLGAVAAAGTARVRAASPGERAAAVALTGGLAVWLLHAGADWIWESTACAVAGLAVIGLLTAAAAKPREGARPRLHAAGRVAAVLVASVAVAGQIPPLAGTSAVRASKQATEAGRHDEAWAKAEDAVRAWPWAASPYLQRALLSERGGDLAAAERDIRRAIDHEPTNWRHPVVLARLLAERGRTREAARAFGRARELRPFSPLFEG